MYIYVQIYTYVSSSLRETLQMLVYMYVYIDAGVYVEIRYRYYAGHIYKYIYIYMYKHTHTQIHIYIYISEFYAWETLEMLVRFTAMFLVYAFCVFFFLGIVFEDKNTTPQGVIFLLLATKSQVLRCVYMHICEYLYIYVLEYIHTLTCTCIKMAYVRCHLFAAFPQVSRVEVYMCTCI